MYVESIELLTSIYIVTVVLKIEVTASGQNMNAAIELAVLPSYNNVRHGGNYLT